MVAVPRKGGECEEVLNRWQGTLIQFADFAEEKE